MEMIARQVAPVVISEATKYISQKATTPTGDLTSAAAKNNTLELRTILSKDPYINRGPALVAASSAGNLSSLDILLEPPETPHHHFSRHHQQQLQQERRERVDVDIWASGTTPLLAAVRNRHVKTTKYLLESGADPDLSPKSGISPIQEAAQTGDLDIIRVLLLYGANVNHHDHAGDTPLIVTSRWGHAHTARCLLQNRARINEANDKGSTALTVAARHDCVDVVECLLDQRWAREKGGRVTVNQRDRKGRTALHRAVEGIWFLERVGSERKEEVVRLLLENGADPWIRDKEGKTPADRAGWLSGSEGLRRLLAGGRRGDRGAQRRHSRSNTL